MIKFYQREWFRHVILRHSLARGLPMGIGIPVLDSLYLPSANSDMLNQFLFSIPFFVIA